MKSLRRSDLSSRPARIGLVVAAAGAVLATGIATAATAAPHATDKAKSFHSSASPRTGVKPGQTITVKGKGPTKKGRYWCAMIVVHGANEVADDFSAKIVRANKHGAITCKQTFETFSGKSKGHTRHCPTTKADRKAGWSCAVALGDYATQGKKSNSVAKFSAKG